jgi:hypothetical protein
MYHTKVQVKHGVSSILTLLGQIYLSQHELDKAADLFQRALHLYQLSMIFQAKEIFMKGLE